MKLYRARVEIKCEFHRNERNVSDQILRIEDDREEREGDQKCADQRGA